MATHFSILAWKIPCTEWLAAQMVENSLVGQTVKSLPAMLETWVQSLGQENPLEKGMATHSSLLAWRIPQRSQVGYSPWGCEESGMSEHTHKQKSIYRCRERISGCQRTEQ